MTNKREENLNLIQTWAEDSDGYESSILYSFWNACQNDRIKDVPSHEPSPKGALAWASSEAKFHDLRCQEAAETFKRLSTKLHDLDE